MTLTPTQQRIYAVLGDGMPHHVDELMACLDDDMTGRVTLRVHLTFIRQRLASAGMSVMNEQRKGVSYYRLVRLLNPHHE